MGTAIAIVLGALVGAVGFVPTFLLAARTQSMVGESRGRALTLLLLSLFVSFIVMVIAILACAKIARDVLLPFSIALAVGLSAVAILYGISTRKK